MNAAFGSIIDENDIIECRVHLGCTKEVSSFELLIQNWNGKYSPGGSRNIPLGAEGYIKIGRTSSPPQIIAGRVESLKYVGKPTENYLRVGGRCVGERLFRRVFTGALENMKGEEIVKYLLDNYVGLSHTRDGTELVENTDTTYTLLEFENTPVYDIIKQIAESADKQGVIGYDFRVAPDGKFEFFPKNSKTSSVSLSDLIEEYEYRKDIFRIRNKITVYGAQTYTAPLDEDAWTESLSNWYVETPPGGQLSLDGDNKKKGNYSIKHHLTQSSFSHVFYLNIYQRTGAYLDSTKFPSINFYVKSSVGCNQSIWGCTAVILIDSSDREAWHITFGTPPANLWTLHQAELDLLHKNWLLMQGSFNWKQVKIIKFQIQTDEYTTSDCWIDWLYFGKGRWEATRQDTGSQNAYGLRELVEVDEELYNDTECGYRANALLNHLKSPAEQITLKTTVLNYGSTPILAGDKIYVSLPNEGVAGYYRVESVEYRVDAKTQTLEVTLELGRETPLLADYLYALRSKTDHLSRYKLGR